jgi:hypothetical protein
MFTHKLVPLTFVPMCISLLDKNPIFPHIDEHFDLRRFPSNWLFVRFQLINQLKDEWNLYLLFSQIDRFAKHPKMLPKTAGDVELQLGAGQVAENGLDLLQDGHVVFLPRLLDVVVAAGRRLVVIWTFRLAVFTAEVLVVVSAS